MRPAVGGVGAVDFRIVEVAVVDPDAAVADGEVLEVEAEGAGAGGVERKVPDIAGGGRIPAAAFDGLGGQRSMKAGSGSA